jgi:transglutaminase-like putative cysteine protease
MAASYRRESFFMRKFLAFITVAAIFLINTLSVNAEGLVIKNVFDTSYISSGVVKVSYSSDIKKLKVLIEKNDKRYSYNLKNDGTVESFPLQMGNGAYKVSVLENVDGNKYKYVSTETINLDIEDQKSVYLTSTQNISWDYNMAVIKKARELTKGLSTDSQKIKTIYNYIINNHEYDFDKLSKLSNDYLPNIDLFLKSGKGICYDYASTLAGMLRSINIPTKLVKGYSINVNGYHAWNEVYNKSSDKWILIDTTYDSQMRAAKAKYTMVKNNSEYTKVNEY